MQQIIGQGPDIYVADIRTGQDTLPGTSLKIALSGADVGRWVPAVANDGGPLVLAVNDAPQGKRALPVPATSGTGHAGSGRAAVDPQSIKDGGYVKANWLQKGQRGYARVKLADTVAGVVGTPLKNGAGGVLTNAVDGDLAKGLIVAQLWQAVAAATSASTAWVKVRGV